MPQSTNSRRVLFRLVLFTFAGWALWFWQVTGLSSLLKSGWTAAATVRQHRPRP